MTRELQGRRDVGRHARGRDGHVTLLGVWRNGIDSAWLRVFAAICITEPPVHLYRGKEQGRRLGGSPGMPSASFGGGAVRVRAPRGYDASAATDRTDRDLPSGDRRAAERAALVEALRTDDFVVVDRIDLTPQRSRDLGGPAPANRVGTVKLDVDVPAGNDAVILLERDGV